MAQNTATAYPRTASILALIGGMFVALGGLLLVVVSYLVLPYINYFSVTTPNGLSPGSLPGLVSGIVRVMGVVGLVTGAVIVFSAIMLLTRSGESRTWGIMILVFSVLSLVGLGGFVVGAILGIVGGVLTLRWKPPTS